MRRSLRVRLQLWYGLVLIAAVVGFAGLMYLQIRNARLRTFDTRLETALHFLESNLRRFPLSSLDTQLPPKPRPRPGMGPPPRLPMEQLLEDLDLPRVVDPGDGSVYLVIWRPDGTVLKSNIDVTTLPTPEKSDFTPLPQVHGRGEFREGRLLGPGRTWILVGRALDRERVYMTNLAWQLSSVGLLTVATGLVGGWFLSGRLLRPITAITQTASRISETNLGERINTAHVDRELEGLVKVLNATFERLETSFLRQARFTSDASHELRTPLAILRSHAELALTRPRTIEEYRETLMTCLQAARRMTALVEGLLMLARSDAGKLEVRRDPVDLQALVEESVALFRPLAQEREIQIWAEVEPLEVEGDAGHLAQVVTNLLSNAVQYNRPGGKVRVTVEADGAAAIVSVTDTGCGISEADQPRLFERFSRVDADRNRSTGGYGLGLAICKSLVEAHGGLITLESDLGRGSTFRVHLPRRAEDFSAVSPAR